MSKREELRGRSRRREGYRVSFTVTAASRHSRASDIPRLKADLSYDYATLVSAENEKRRIRGRNAKDKRRFEL